MINPADIQLDKLPSVALDEKANLPETPSIYFAIDSQGVVQYVGQSINPRQRWASHEQLPSLASMGGVKISYVRCSVRELNALELWFIRSLTPAGNSSRTVPFVRKTLSSPVKVKRVIDISAYWPTDELGSQYSLNKVHKSLDLNPEKIGRYTLQKAKAGELGGGEIGTLYDLVAACSRWSNRVLELKDLIKEVPNE